MDTDITDIAQNITTDSNAIEEKRKCLTNSEYNVMIFWIDSLINDPNNFILNEYGWLIKKTCSEYPHLNENTVMSIIDGRIQYYVRQRHHRAFGTTSTKTPTIATTPNQSPNNHNQQHKRLINSKKTMYDRYKELASNTSVTSPLKMLADNLRMPAMLVAKVVLADQIQAVEKQKEEQLYRLRYPNNVDSLNSIILNDSSGKSTENNLNNDSNTVLTQDCENNYGTTELDLSSNVDAQLSQQLNWLTNKLLSMRKISPVKVLNQSTNSSINSNSIGIQTANKMSCLTPHQLATSTWLIRSDPMLAYQVYKCSVIDGYYGSCTEFIKSCTGKRFEQLLKHNMKCVTTGSKSQTNRQSNNFIYITEKECRIRGLDMTPDMVLNEPIAISLTDDNCIEDDQEHIATNYVGGSNDGIRVLNWIESKATFGGPEQLRVAMQRQLFPYWNRYGPGAVIFWFGYVLDWEESQNDQTGIISTNKVNVSDSSASNTNSPVKVNSTVSSTQNFWSKYCVLMDGFPASNKIIMYNHRYNHRQISTKKKN